MFTARQQLDGAARRLYNEDLRPAETELRESLEMAVEND
jgi:hypothetical protein